MGTTAEKLQAIVNSKETIRQAIVNKNVACDITVPLDEYANKIAAISTGGSTSISREHVTAVGTTRQFNKGDSGFIVINAYNCSLQVGKYSWLPMPQVSYTLIYSCYNGKFYNLMIDSTEEATLDYLGVRLDGPSSKLYIYKMDYKKVKK